MRTEDRPIPPTWGSPSAIGCLPGVLPARVLTAHVLTAHVLAERDGTRLLGLS